MVLAASRLKQNASALPNTFGNFCKLVMCSLKTLMSQMLSLQLDLRRKP